MKPTKKAEVIIIGGGIAGLSAAVYLSRAMRDTLVVDGGKSMARWEPDVQNYLGFPNGVGGTELISRGRRQARRYGAKFVNDMVIGGQKRPVRSLFRERSIDIPANGCWLPLAYSTFHQTFPE